MNRSILFTLGSLLLFTPTVGAGCGGSTLLVGTDPDGGGTNPPDGASQSDGASTDSSTPVPNICTTKGGICEVVLSGPDGGYGCPSGYHPSADSCGAAGGDCCAPDQDTPSACGAAGGVCVNVLGQPDGGYPCPPEHVESNLSCGPGGGDCCVPIIQTDAGCRSASDCTSGPDSCSLCGAPLNHLVCDNGQCVCACQSARCSLNSDCRTAADYCSGGCSCLALGPDEPNPACDAGVTCIVDPCGGHSAICDGTGHCVLQ